MIAVDFLKLLHFSSDSFDVIASKTAKKIPYSSMTDMKIERRE